MPRYEKANLVWPVVTQGKEEARVRLDFTVGEESYTAVRVVRRSAQGRATTKAAVLERDGLVRGFAFEPRGYSYFLRGRVDTVRLGNAFITGDAAGLATRDLAEGIGPAVRSGQRAADAILGNTMLPPESIEVYRAPDAGRFEASRGG